MYICRAPLFNRVYCETFINVFTTNKLCIRSLSVFGFLMKFRIVCSTSSSWQRGKKYYKAKYRKKKKNKRNWRKKKVRNAGPHKTPGGLPNARSSRSSSCLASHTSWSATPMRSSDSYPVSYLPTWPYTIYISMYTFVCGSVVVSALCGFIWCASTSGFHWKLGADSSSLAAVSCGSFSHSHTHMHTHVQLYFIILVNIIGCFQLRIMCIE